MEKYLVSMKIEVSTFLMPLCMFSIICKTCSPCSARDPYAVDRGVLLCVLPRSPFNPHRHSHWMRGWKCVSLFWRHHKR